MKKNFVVAITGASGAAYAMRLLDVVLAAGCNVHLSISPAARAVLAEELDLDVDLEHFEAARLMLGRAGDAGELQYHHHADLTASIASGSFRTDGMVVCPCSGGTLSAIAHAASTNLIQRAAEVHLKERRTLVLVPRETPLSVLQLENMVQAARAGAVILPAMPGFYHGVTDVRDLIDFVVGRICDQLGIENALIRRWGT